MHAEFALAYPNMTPPVKCSIFNLYSKFEATGSITDALHELMSAVLTPWKLDEVVTLFTENLQISLQKGWQAFSHGNIADKYRYVSIFLDIESMDTKTKISINIENRNVLKI